LPTLPAEVILGGISRLARLIVPGFPHHVTQRGNRRAPVFFEEGDYALYRDLLAERCRRASVACRAAA